MPEFETRKRKTMSEQELYREYHGEENAPRKASDRKSKNSSGKKGNSFGKKSASNHNEEKRAREELRQKQATAKKSKTYAGKTTGRTPQRTSGRTSGKASQSSTDPSLRGQSHSYSNFSSNSSSKSPSKSSSRSSLRLNSGSARKGRRGASSEQRGGQKKRTGKYTLYYVLIGLLAVIALTVLSTTVLFNIGVFVVSGETVYSDEEIIEACGIEKGENLLKINTGRAESKIVSQLVYIDSAKVYRGFPNRLTLSVTPAKPTVAFAFGGKYYVISERKRLLEISDTPLDCPVIKGVQMILQPKEEKEETTAADSGTANSPLTSKEGITLEKGEGEEISVGVILGDDANHRINLALSIAKLMAENGLTKNYEVNIADTLGVLISYDGHIKMELGTTAALDEKIYKASRIIEEDIGENENCTLNLTNPNRAVKRPVYEGGEVSTVTTAPETAVGEETKEDPAAPEP